MIEQKTAQDMPFPWRYVITFFACVALTALAIFVTVSLHMPRAVVVVIILGMALIQVILQLTMLLHASFKDERWVRGAVLAGATFIAIIVVSFTYLVMSFNSAVS